MAARQRRWVVGPALLAAVLAAQAARAADVWTWKDRQGSTHFGDAAAATGQPGATRVEIGDAGVPEADRRAAQDRLARDRAILDAAAVADPVPVPAPGARRARKAASEPTSCEEAWQRYDDSYACFDPYRMAYGRVRPEAWQHCKEVQQPPELCRRR